MSRFTIISHTMVNVGARAATRLTLARRIPCCKGCPGFFASDGVYGLQIERCDECADANGYAGFIFDEDVRAMPGAISMLIAADTAMRAAS